MIQIYNSVLNLWNDWFVIIFFFFFLQFQSIIKFWQSVMDAMGPNIHVFVEDVKESNHVMVTAFMHLGL